LVIKRWDKYILVRDRSGMQLINTSMQHSDTAPYGHIHSIDEISYAKRLVDAAERHTVPRKRCIEFLEDLRMITSDRSLRKEIDEVIQAKIDRKQSKEYVNHTGGGKYI
jgi:hypothetical protein